MPMHNFSSNFPTPVPSFPSLILFPVLVMLLWRVNSLQVLWNSLTFNPTVCGNPAKSFGYPHQAYMYIIVNATITLKMLHTHTHTHLTALCPGLPRWAGTRKVKPIWILLEQEIVSGSGISWAVCKSAPRSRQITTPAPTTQFFTGRMPFLPPNQQHQSNEGMR